MKHTRVERYEPKPGEPVKGNGVGMGWRAPRYRRTHFEEPTIKPSELGYPATEQEAETFARRQYARANLTLSTRGSGLLTASEAWRIRCAREKRERREARQAEGMLKRWET